MNRMLIEYVRDIQHDSYEDVEEFLADVNEGGYEEKARRLGAVVWYIANVEGGEEEVETAVHEKPIMEYIRDHEQCNYFDIIDYFSELNQCGFELKGKYLEELIEYISRNEKDGVHG